MPKTNLSKLNDELFAQLDRLSQPDIPDNQLDKELKRVMPVIEISKSVIEIGKLSLAASKFQADHCGRAGKMPVMLEQSED